MGESLPGVVCDLNYAPHLSANPLNENPESPTSLIGVCGRLPPGFAAQQGLQQIEVGALMFYGEHR